MRLGDTPVPIPNTTVKTQSADGTALETVWESRWAPDQKKKNWIYQWWEILNEAEKAFEISDDWWKSQSDEELDKDFILCTLKTAYSKNQ